MLLMSDDRNVENQTRFFQAKIVNSQKPFTMSLTPSSVELNKYWALLNPAQKRSLLTVIGSFTQPADSKNPELNEPEASYDNENAALPEAVLQQLNWEQKEALVALILSFGIEIPGQRVSLEEYNKELNEAMAEIEKGEFYTHEEVVAMSKTWVSGK